MQRIWWGNKFGNNYVWLSLDVNFKLIPEGAGFIREYLLYNVLPQKYPEVCAYRGWTWKYFGQQTDTAALGFNYLKFAILGIQ